MNPQEKQELIKSHSEMLIVLIAYYKEHLLKVTKQHPARVAIKKTIKEAIRLHNTTFH
jgi:hypothetical protein